MRRKIHIGIDANTLEVRAVEMTSNRIGDAPVLPDLLAQIPAQERIGSVIADGVYDTKGCHAAIAARGADATSGILSNQWRSCPPPAATECPGLEGPGSGAAGAQRSATCLQTLRPGQLEEMVRISPTKPRGSQDDLAGSLEPVAFTCSTSSSSASASWPETSTGRMQRSRSASHS